LAPLLRLLASVPPRSSSVRLLPARISAASLATPAPLAVSVLLAPMRPPASLRRLAPRASSAVLWPVTRPVLPMPLPVMRPPCALRNTPV
jgi:hypothetical protein